MTTVLTRVVARLLLAPVLVVAVAVLVKGYVGVGDGFAAGVIAALGVLLQYVAFGRETVERALPVRRAAQLSGAGLALALVVTLVPTALGDAPLTHRPSPGTEPLHVGTVEVITAVAFDVGIFTLVLGAMIATIHAIAVAGEEER